MRSVLGVLTGNVFDYEERFQNGAGQAKGFPVEAARNQMADSEPKPKGF